MQLNLFFMAAAGTMLHQDQLSFIQFSDSPNTRLGFRLFVRKSQPLRFTPQGEIICCNRRIRRCFTIASALQSCNEPQQT